MNKGFIFGGDSFVWGEGVNLFSECEIIQHLKNEKQDFEGSKKYSAESWKYQVENRFAGLVADHYDTFSLVFDRNGGDNYSCLDELIYLIKNTNLNSIGTIIYQPTAIWRTTNIVQHPIMTTFREPAELSLHSTTKEYQPLGNGKGLKKHDLRVNDDYLIDFFNGIDNDLMILLELGVAWESKWNNKKLIKEYAQESTNENCHINEIEKNIETYYDFLLTEFSEYGNTAITILENLQKKLVIDCVDFIKTQILPMINSDIKFLFLETWCNEYKSWRSINDTFYKDNVIEIEPHWGEYQDELQINRYKGLEWTNNMHPTVDGHKFWKDKIINYLDKNKI